LLKRESLNLKIDKVRMIMIINWCIYETKTGMRELFCRELLASGLLHKCQTQALWYKVYLPIDGAEKVLVYQGWESAEAIERHNQAAYISQLKELKEYYVTRTVNEGYEAEEQISFSIEEISKALPGHVAGWCTYQMFPNKKEEFCRKVIRSGIYEICKNDANYFEFLLPYDEVDEVVILERWEDDRQMLAHCVADHVTFDLCALKQGYVEANSCVGFRYNEPISVNLE